MRLAHKICALIRKKDGLTAKEIAEELLGPGTPQPRVNPTCLKLVEKGLLKRGRTEGKYRYYVSAVDVADVQTSTSSDGQRRDPLSEDSLKAALKKHLEADGWRVEIAWGKERGVDIAARRASRLWKIEVKGCGSTSQAQGNNFLGGLGELLQRMDDPLSDYSFAMPDLPRYRNLWKKLPRLARLCTGITAIFVNENGVIEKTKPITIAASDLATMKRKLFGILDRVEGNKNRSQSAPKRITSLRDQGKIPRQVASLMLTIITFRNVAEHDDHDPTARESRAILWSWTAVIEWAQSKGFHSNP